MKLISYTILLLGISVTATATKPLPITQPETFPIIIDQPGSYIFTENIFGVSNLDGIQVTADNVTIDMGGFALIGLVDSQDGILPINVENLTVINGTIRTWQSAIYGNGSQNCTFRDLRVTNNRFNGIHGGSSCTIENCTVTYNNTGGGGVGIETGSYSIIKNCVAFANSGISSGAATGIEVDDHCIITGCTSAENDGRASSGGTGIRAGSNCKISDNTCTNNDAGLTGGNGTGIIAGARSIVMRNTCNNNGGTGGNSLAIGIVANDNSSVIENTCSGNNGTGTGSGSGIAVGENVRIEGNLCSTNSTYGIRIQPGAEGCTIVKNSTSGNGTAGIRFEGAGTIQYCAENLIDEPTAFSLPGVTVMGTGDRANVLY